MANIYMGTLGNDDTNGHWDELYGLEGDDVLNSHWDTITDFVSGEDKFWLGADASTLVGTPLTSREFRIGILALDPDDRLIYERAAGRLWQDLDGSGSTPATILAVFSNKPTLVLTDFVIG